MKRKKETFAVKVIILTASNVDFTVNEVKILRSVSHANTLEIREAYFHNETLFIMTELIDGLSLHVLLKQDRPGEMFIAAIAKQLFKALEYIHQQKIIHRDVKTNNIMVSKTGVVKLIDFGLATVRLAGPPFDTVGTLNYVPPEVIKNGIQDTPGDVWSAGIIMIEMINRETPHYDLTNLAIMRHIVAHGAPDIQHSISTHLADFLGKALVKDPGARQTATELLKHTFLDTAISNDMLGNWVEDAMPPERRKMCLLGCVL